jgi:hypothetical protein
MFARLMWQQLLNSVVFLNLFVQTLQRMTSSAVWHSSVCILNYWSPESNLKRFGTIGTHDLHALMRKALSGRWGLQTRLYLCNHTFVPGVGSRVIS